MQHKPQPGPRNAPRSRPFTQRQPHSPQAPQKYELVDPRWLLKALAAALGVALLLAYVTICVVFSRTQWQLVLSPSRTLSATPAASRLDFTEVHFGDDQSGQPQLDGWWIPGDAPADASVILLHKGSGSMSDALPDARLLHASHLAVLLFDYRGFGNSGGRHPTQQLMQADAESAYSYMTGVRGIAPGSLVVWGDGVGASLAVRLCADHPQIAALILQSPEGDLQTKVREEVRSWIIPVRLLFHETFPLAAPLSTLSTPKLLISFTGGPAPRMLQRAADPKMLVEARAGDSVSLQQSLTRFLSTYVPRQSAP